MTDWYQVLGVDASASSEQIRQAYRQRARETHPDLNARPTAVDEFVKVREAYQVLKDAASRARYDASRIPSTFTPIRYQKIDLYA